MAASFPKIPHSVQPRYYPLTIPLLIFLFFACLRTHALAQKSTLPPIRYTCQVQDIRTQRFHVSISFTPPDISPVEFAIPAWTPGYYQILHFENHIGQVSAADDKGRLLKITHPTPLLWRVEPGASGIPITLSYDVHADDEVCEESLSSR